MELRHLRYFVAVAEEGHFGRAATRLHISQPPLSRQIRQLEARVGTPLLQRTGRGARPTVAGQVFLEGARQTLARADDAVRQAVAAARGESGRLAIGFVESTVYGGAPVDALQRFRSRHPGMAVDLLRLTSVEQWEALCRGRIHLGFVYDLPRPGQGFRSRVVARDPLELALPASHPLARGRRVPVRSLHDLPFVWLPRAFAPTLHDRVARAMRRRGVVPKLVQEAEHVATRLFLVAAGVGATLVGASARHAAPRGVLLRPVAGMSLVGEVHALWREDADPALATLLRSLPARA